MAQPNKKSIITRTEIPGMWYVRFKFRPDIDFFATDLEDLTKTLKTKYPTQAPDIFELQYWLSKPVFKKLTTKEYNKLGIL